MGKNKENVLFVKKLTKTAIVPKKHSEQAAGYDLYSDETKVIPPREITSIKTGVAIEPPEGCYGKVTSRSGLVSKQKITAVIGTIDRDFRGEICVFLVNNNDFSVEVKYGERIAQLILEKIVEDEVLRETEHLSETARGDKGFGSTGRF